MLAQLIKLFKGDELWVLCFFLKPRLTVGGVKHNLKPKRTVVVLIMWFYTSEVTFQVTALFLEWPYDNCTCTVVSFNSLC